ncbi:Crp/Fnr family transcriptional regulator [Cytobacillus sp. Hm23]
MIIIDDIKLKQSFISQWSIHNMLPEEIISKFILCKYGNGELIIDSKDNLNDLYFLVEGRVKTYLINQEGKVFLYKFFNPLSLFGELEYITNQSRCSFYHETIMESYVLKITSTHLAQLNDNDNLKFSKYLNGILAHKLASTTDLLSLFVYSSLEERLASYLFHISEEIGNFQSSYTVKFNELAHLLGTSYRHLLRTLKKLEAQGLLMREKSRIKVINEMKLKEMVIVDLYE